MKTNFYRAFAIGLVGAFGILAGATCAIAATNIGTDITTGGNLTVSGFGHETIGNIGGIDQSIWAFGDPFETSFNNSVDINLNKNISGDLSTKDAYESLAAYPTYTHTGTNPAQITDIDAESFISAASTGPIDKQIGAFISPSNRGSGHVNRLIGVYPQAYNYGVGTVDVATAVYGNAANSGPGTITNLSGIYTFPSINYGAGTVTNGYGVYVNPPANSGGGTVTNNYAIWIADQTLAGACSYGFWYDSPGVFRIKNDGVMAYYNPAFVKYTPCATNFERIVTQWNSNVAEIGTEAGGTGVLRPLRLLGSQLDIPNHLNTASSNNDVDGTITLSSATSASHTFTTAFNSAPVCTLTPTSDATALGIPWVTTTVSAVTAHVPTSGSITFDYHCVGNPN